MNSTQSQIVLKPIERVHADSIAKLRIEGINTGFISSLGIDFVRSLYRAIVESKHTFGFVAEENGEVLGFVAFTENRIKLYGLVILKKGMRFILQLADRMFSLRRIKKVFETFFYPFRTKRMGLPTASLISIVVVQKARGKGLAGRLIEMGFEECKRRGIKKVKVMVSVDNEPANKLYLKCGFKLAAQIEVHGVPSNIYVAQLPSAFNKLTEGWSGNRYAEFLREEGTQVITVKGVDWREYSSWFMVPVNLMHCCPEGITAEEAAEVLRISGRSLARWSSMFGQVQNTEWWFVLKRGSWTIEDIKDKKIRWMIRQGKKNFTVRHLTYDEVVSKCPRVAQSAATRYKGKTDVESQEILERRVQAAQKISGVLEFIGCFQRDILVSYSENHIQNNAVWLVNIRNDPAFLNKYSSYALMDGILDYYLNKQKMDYVLDGSRNIYHRTKFQEHLMRVFGFTKEYALLRVVYTPKFQMAVKLAYPFRSIVWSLCDKWVNRTLDNVGAVLLQEDIRRACSILLESS